MTGRELGLRDMSLREPGMSEREQLAALGVEVHHLTEAVRELERKVDGLNAQANRWKGAFLVVLSMGAAVGWLADRASSLWGAP